MTRSEATFVKQLAKLWFHISFNKLRTVPEPRLCRSFWSRGGPVGTLDWTLQATTTRGPSWGHSSVVLGTIVSFLEPFRGHVSPKFGKVSEKLTLRYPHEGPCVAFHPLGAFHLSRRFWTPRDVLSQSA